MLNLRMIAGESISRQTVKDQVADKLAFMIQTGLLQPGDQLPSERQLAATLNVSRESVRGAIAALRARHMIHVSQGSASRVAAAADVPIQELIGGLSQLEDSDIEQVGEARSHFEVELARLAAQRISPDDLQRLEVLLAEQQSMLDDPVRFQISDREFHMVIYGACGNVLMANVVSELYYFALDARRRALQRQNAIVASVHDHGRIVAALRAGNTHEAAEAMLAHQQRVHMTTRRELIS